MGFSHEPISVIWLLGIQRLLGWLGSGVTRDVKSIGVIQAMRKLGLLGLLSRALSYPKLAEQPLQPPFKKDNGLYMLLNSMRV